MKRRFGWRRASRADEWAKVDSPASLLARGARLVASCSAGACPWRVRFDPQLWIARGMGDVNMSTIQAAYMCARVPCGLRWQGETYADGIPLVCYVQVAGSEVSCTCTACKMRKMLAARAFVE